MMSEMCSKERRKEGKECDESNKIRMMNEPETQLRMGDSHIWSSTMDAWNTFTLSQFCMSGRKTQNNRGIHLGSKIIWNQSQQ